MTEAKLRLVIADDHPVVLAGLAGLFLNSPHFEVVASCEDGHEAVELVRKFRPDILVTDMMMPGLTGLGVLRCVRQDRVGTRIVILTASASDKQVNDAVLEGVDGLLFKDTAVEKLEACLRAVAGGDRWLDAQVVGPALARERERSRDELTYKESLTERERQVATLVRRGLSNKEIGRELSISDGTVRIHLNNIFRKLGISNRAALAVASERFDADVSGRSA